MHRHVNLGYNEDTVEQWVGCIYLEYDDEKILLRNLASICFYKTQNLDSDNPEMVKFADAIMGVGYQLPIGPGLIRGELRPRRRACAI